MNSLAVLNFCNKTLTGCQRLNFLMWLGRNFNKLLLMQIAVYKVRRSINAVIKLFLPLRETHGLKLIMTCCLKQNFCRPISVGVIRTRGGCCDNTTAVQFTNHFDFERACCTLLLMQIAAFNVASGDNHMLLRSFLSSKLYEDKRT